MAEDNKFTELKSTLIKAKQPGADDAAKADNKRDSKGRAYATGRRKESVARVWIKPGTGKITVNGRDEAVYFARPVLRMILRQPLIAAGRDGQFDVVVTVNGGGLSGQAGAVRHGISRALVNYEPTLRPVLKPGGFLTRDPRAVNARNMAGRRRAAASNSPSANRAYQKRERRGAIRAVFLCAVMKAQTAGFTVGSNTGGGGPKALSPASPGWHQK